MNEIQGVNIKDVKLKINEIFKRVGYERLINSLKNRNLEASEIAPPEAMFKKKCARTLGSIQRI